LKNYPQASSLLESVLANNVDWPEFRYNLGMAYLRNGQLDKAKVELTEAMADKAEYFGREEAAAELKKL
jgi:Tfp pilus assembly protein PilF